MVVVPVKWMPALLLLGGACWAFSGDSDSWLGFVLAAVGAVWSYFWYLAPQGNKA